MKQLLLALLCLISIHTYSQKKAEPRKVDAATFQSILETEKSVQLIDVRTPEEFSAGHIEDAVNINIYDPEFLVRLNSLNKKKPVLVYCKGGGRSADAAAQMKLMGFKNVVELQQGIMGWEKENRPIVSGVVTDKANRFTRAHLDSLLATHPNLVIDYYAVWCGPCKQMEPSLKTLSNQYKDEVVIYRLNVDEAKKLSRELGITAIPYFEFYKNKQLIDTAAGYQSLDALRTKVKKLLDKK